MREEDGGEVGYVVVGVGEGGVGEVWGFDGSMLEAWVGVEAALGTEEALDEAVLLLLCGGEKVCGRSPDAFELFGESLPRALSETLSMETKVWLAITSILFPSPKYALNLFLTGS